MTRFRPGVWYAGLILFPSPFLVQWILSQRRGESVIPPAFRWLCIACGMTLVSYSLWRRDPVFILGQGVDLVVCVRNLVLIARAPARVARVTAARHGMAALAGVLLHPLLLIDETRHLAAAWEASQRADPVLLTRDFDPCTHKPQLMFRSIDAVWLLTGVSGFAARLVGPAYGRAAIWPTGRPARPAAAPAAGLGADRCAADAPGRAASRAGPGHAAHHGAVPGAAGRSHRLGPAGRSVAAAVADRAAGVRPAADRAVRLCPVVARAAGSGRSAEPRPVSICHGSITCPG